MHKIKFKFLIPFSIYLVFLLVCFFSFTGSDSLNLGRRPLENLKTSAGELLYPSFLDIWYGNRNFEYKNDEGEILRQEDRQEVEKEYFLSILRALWVTIKIGTLGSALAALLAIPLGVLSANNLKFPKVLKMTSDTILNFSRSIHTLIFGLFFVGIVGLGPTAGILAIALHSLGTYGKLYAESIESLDQGPLLGVRSVGANSLQVFFFGIWPMVLPQLISTHLYIWEFNIRDSTILGMVGAGGLGLLVSESISLFQWSRLSTLVLIIVSMVSLFNWGSQFLRKKTL